MDNIYASYKGNHLGKETVAAASEEEINKELDNLLKQHVSTSAKTGEAEKGDIANIDFEGFLDGVAFEGGKGEKYDLELGSNTFIPGFEDQLLGHKAGEEVDVNVTFPENYQAQNLAGKPVVFKCKIHEVKAKVQPQLNDEFALSLGLKTLEELKGAVKAKIERDRQSQANNSYLEKLLRTLVTSSTIEVTEEEINKAKENIIEYYTNAVAQYGMTLDSYISAIGMNQEKFDATIAEEAKNTAKTDVYTSYVAKTESLQPTEAEINEEIRLIQDYYHLDDAKINEFISTKRDALVADLTKEKVARFLLDNND